MKLSPRMRRIMYAAMAITAIAVLAFTTWVSHRAAMARTCTGMLVSVHDTARIHFVDPRELAADLGQLPHKATTMALRDIDTDSLEQLLQSMDKIERAQVNVLTDGRILIDVWPMYPVARIFDHWGHSYYINRQGKRIEADARFWLDVPVIAGDFDALRPASSLIPLVDFIESHPKWHDAVSMIKQESSGDVILIPVIRGHVINIGDTTDYPDKFRRVEAFYSKVMPVKGWEFYDTISVKWRGQVVATRRHKQLPQPDYDFPTEIIEQTDVATGEVDDGIKTQVHSEKPIPAAINNQTKETNQTPHTP